MAKKKAGGGLVANKYDAKGSPAMKEASDKKDGFKKGGAVKAFKRGGAVTGSKTKSRADRGGRSPFSSAKSVKGRPGGMYNGRANDSHDD